MSLVPPVHIRGASSLEATANRVANSLLAKGVSQGDTIAIASPNCREFLAIYFATIRAGMYCVPINWRLSPPEVTRILHDSEAKALFLHSRVQGLQSAIPETIDSQLRVILGEDATDGSGSVTFSGFIRLAPEGRPPCEVEGRLMAFTSATTGFAKGVRRTLAPATKPRSMDVAERATRAKHGFALPSNGVHLVCSQFYHAPVLNLVGSELENENTVVVVETWSPEEMLSLIEKCKVTTTFLVPSMFVRLLKLPEVVRSKYDLSSLRFVLHSGAPCPTAVKRAMMDWWGPILWERYGSVEGPVTLVGPDEWLRHPGTVGRADRGIDIKILDDNGDELPHGTAGTIYIRSRPEFAFEYKGDMEKTLASRYGCYYTVGDIGYLDGEGYLFLCDRKADTIISGGVNIYAAEIEQVLLQNPLVLDCAVIGAPHELLGEVPRAVVQLDTKVPRMPSLAWDLMGYLRERLATYKLPHRIDFVDELPRDPNGKLFKRLLR